MELVQGRRKFFSIAMGLVAAVGLSAAIATPAFASDVAYNENAVITAKAVDPTYDNSLQTIEASVTFGSSVADVSAADMEAYLQDNITIASRTIANDTVDSYYRDVYDVAIDGNTVTFVIGPNQSGMTANYSAELLLKANADYATKADEEVGETVSAAMGNASAETIIGSQIAVESVSVSGDTATFAVTARAQARQMNHILITDVVNGKETAIFSGTGTFANGGITIHSHSFMNQQPADYAASIVSAATSAAGSTPAYTFATGTDGQFTITKAASASASNIKVYVYDCDYLNANKLSVGQISEKEWAE